MRITDDGEVIPRAEAPSSELLAWYARCESRGIVRSIGVQRARLLRRAWRRGVWSTRETLNESVYRAATIAAARIVWALLRGDVLARRKTHARRADAWALSSEGPHVVAVSLAADIRAARMRGARAPNCPVCAHPTARHHPSCPGPQYAIPPEEM